MALNRKKYQNTILYICQKLNGKVYGKKKLAKLLYFADFDFYEKNQRSITGDVYRALPMGPFPVSLEEITAQMVKEKKLGIKRIKEHEGYLPTEIYECIANPEESSIDIEEKKMLDRIIKRYGQLTGKQLEELSHAEAPYTAAEPNKEVPYEFTYYRGTDFSDL